MKIRKGDTVKIIAGNDRGTQGKVLRVFPLQNMLLVEGVNVRKKHVRPRRQGQKGEVIQRPVPIPVSRVMLVCPKCAKPTRVGIKIEKGIRARACKKCGGAI